MKRRKLIGALLCSACLTAGSIVPSVTVSADAMRVVTLGADLSEEQKNTMMRYFKVSADEVEVMYITNEDEREHLSAYVPLEQIGSRTVSCAYVRPTQSGGIKVRTANLNWVTGNMIASTLSTSGVKNCEVIAACPFEVSGTGALTGIQMAYETASGEKLDETKKQIATEEIVVTGNLADEVGKNDATTVINQSKMEIIENNVQNADEIYNIVQNIAQQNNVTVDSEQLDQIVALLEQIAKQGYVYDDVKETLEHVDENVSGENTGNEQSEEELDEDSIMNDVDEDILGDDVIASSTEDPLLEQETGDGDELVEVEDPFADNEADDMEEFEGFGEDDLIDAEEPGSEETPQSTEPGGDEMVEGTEPPIGDGATVGGVDDSEVELSSLSEQAQSMYEDLKAFCAGEYEGDIVSLQGVMGEDAVVSVTLETETAQKLTGKVQDAYFQILNEGAASYVPSESDSYMSAELNMMYAELQKLFGIDDAVTDDGEDILSEVPQEDRQTLFDDTVKFFEKLYGEEGFEEYTETAIPEAEGAETDIPAAETSEDISAEEIPEAQEEYVEY